MKIKPDHVCEADELDYMLSLKSRMKKEDKYAKKIKDEVIGAFAELAGTVWGLEAHHRVWTDKEISFFNIKCVELRNGILKLLK